MTFADIQAQVADRLNLTSPDALQRIGLSINERYRQMASSIGLETTVRGSVTATTSIGQQTLTFGPTPVGVQKLYTVYNPAFTPVTVLDQVSFEELRQTVPGTDPPYSFAVQNVGANYVTILLDCVPASAYALNADADLNLTALTGTAVPVFPENFHNALIYGAMATELDKMEKYDMAQVQEKRYEIILSNLRYYFAASAYLDIYQGKLPATGGLLNQLVGP